MSRERNHRDRVSEMIRQSWLTNDYQYVSYRKIQDELKQHRLFHVVRSDYETLWDHEDIETERRTHLVLCQKLTAQIALGAVRFVRTYEEWTSRVYYDPQLLDALEAAEASMVQLNDQHHVFFEGFGKSAIQSDGVTTHITLLMGS